MASPTELVLTITARDQASDAFRQTQEKIKASSDEFNKSFSGMTGAVDGLRSAFGKLGGQIPGVSSSLQALSGVMSSSVLGAATGLVGAMTTYGLALNRVTDDQLRFQRALHSLNADTIRGELSRVNDELNRMSDIGNRIGNQAGTWTGALQSFLSRFQALPQAARELFLGAQTPESQRREAESVFNGVSSMRDNAIQSGLQSQIENSRQRTLLFELNRRLNDNDLTGAQKLLPQIEASDRLEERRALDRLRIDQGMRRAEQMRTLPEDPAVRQQTLDRLAVTEDLERKALQAEQANNNRRQKIAREEQMRQVFERLLFPGGLPVESGQGFETAIAGRGAGEGPSTQALVGAARSEQQFLGEIFGGDNPEQFAGGAEGVGVGPTPAEVASGTQRRIAGEKELLAIQQESLGVNIQMAELARQRPGLTQAERDAIETTVSLERERLTLKQLDLQITEKSTEEEKALVEQKKQLVQAQEAIQRSVIETQRLQREDPAAGLQAGFRDIGEIGASAGARLRGELVSSFHDINQSFSDIVIDGIYNKAENASEIGRQLGKKLLTGFVDQITTGLTSRVFGALQSALGIGGSTGGRVLSAVPLVASPFSGGGGGAPAAAGTDGGFGGILNSGYNAFAGGSGGAATSPATVTASGIRPSGASASVATGGGSLISDLTGGIGQFAQGFFSSPSLSLTGVIGAYNAGGLAGISAAQSLVAAGISESAAVATVAATAAEGGYAIGIGGSAAAVGAEAPAYGSGALSGAGGAAGSIAGGVLAAAALAYTAYSAYQSGDVVGGLVGGAVSGAALGTAIYPGVGTVVGLIAGAAIGGGAGAAGKEEQEVKGDRRRNEAERQRLGAYIYQDLMNAISTGVDQEDVAGLTVRTGQSVGGLLAGVAALNRAGFLSGDPWGWAPSENAKQTLEILVGFGVEPILDFEWDRLNSTAELIASWHQPRGITAGNIEISKNAEALMAAFVQKSGSQILIGYDEELSTGLRGAAGRLTRETLLLSSRAREAAGQDLFVVDNSTDGLSEDAVARLLQRMAKIDRDRDLQILRVESDFGATVSLGNVTV